jgi:outer membrane immunogenic protein
MRRQSFLATVGAIALTGSAFAADLAPPPPAYVPPAPYSWTGLYAGLQVGYAWGKDPSDTTFITPTIAAVPPTDLAPGTPGVAGIFLNDSFGHNPQGVIGGAHAGYQLQLTQWSWFSSSGVVIGVEGSVDGTSINNTVFDPFSELAVRTQVPVEGSIRLRAGVAWDRLLVYATGGAAFTSIKDSYTDTTGFVTGTLGFAPGVPGAYEAITKNRSGWTVGGGLQYAVTDNWSIGAEYRYSDFGHYTDYPFTSYVAVGVSNIGPAALSDVLTVQHHLTQNQVQVSLTYKFGSPAAAPVVAKY